MQPAVRRLDHGGDFGAIGLLEAVSLLRCDRRRERRDGVPELGALRWAFQVNRHLRQHSLNDHAR